MLRKCCTALFLVSALISGVFYIPSALAVHLLVFELDGDATHVTAHDWDQVWNDSKTNPAGTTSGATALSFVTETNLNASIFTGGGSKDPQDVNQWAWKDGAGGLPDKDNLLHAFAARYSLDPTAFDGNCPNGTGGPGEPTWDPTKKCEVLYFG